MSFNVWNIWILNELYVLVYYVFVKVSFVFDKVFNDELEEIWKMFMKKNLGNF